MVFKRLFVFANLKCIKRPLSQQEPSQTSFLSCQQIRKGRHHTQAGCNGDEDKDWCCGVCSIIFWYFESFFSLKWTLPSLCWWCIVCFDKFADTTKYAKFPVDFTSKQNQNSDEFNSIWESTNLSQIILTIFWWFCVPFPPFIVISTRE